MDYICSFISFYSQYILISYYGTINYYIFYSLEAVRTFKIFKTPNTTTNKF